EFRRVLFRSRRVVPDRSGALPEYGIGAAPGFFPSPEGSSFPPGAVRLYPFLRLAKTLPTLMSVSATTPNPTHRSIPSSPRDRKSTRLNSSHQITSYAVFCLKKTTTT